MFLWFSYGFGEHQWWGPGTGPADGKVGDQSQPADTLLAVNGNGAKTLVYIEIWGKTQLVGGWALPLWKKYIKIWICQLGWWNS